MTQHECDKLIAASLDIFEKLEKLLVVPLSQDDAKAILDQWFAIKPQYDKWLDSGCNLYTPPELLDEPD